MVVQRLSMSVQRLSMAMPKLYKVIRYRQKAKKTNVAKHEFTCQEARPCSACCIKGTNFRRYVPVVWKNRRALAFGNNISEDLSYCLEKGRSTTMSHHEHNLAMSKNQPINRGIFPSFGCPILTSPHFHFVPD